jgi:hypothetical protein
MADEQKVDTASQGSSDLPYHNAETEQIAKDREAAPVAETVAEDGSETE